MAKLFSLIIISFLFVIINANDTYSNEYMQNRKDVDGQSYQSSAEATPVHYKNDNNIIYGSKPNNNEYNNPNIYTDIYKPTTTQQTTTKATYEIYEPKLEEDKVYDHKMEDKKENNHSYQTTSHKTNANIYEPKSNEEISYGHMMENKKHQENFNSYITPSSTQSTSTKGYEMNAYASQYEQSSNIYEQDTTTSMNVYENTYENEMDMNRYEKPTENKYEQGMNQYEQENKVENIYGEGYSADYNKMSQNIKCNPIVDLTALPGNCRKFQRCANGILYVMNCPSNLVFDNRIKVCNYPQNVPAPCGTQKISSYEMISNKYNY